MDFVEGTFGTDLSIGGKLLNVVVGDLVRFPNCQ